MNKIALLIIYNHRFDRNIPILEKMYEGVFSHIFHIIPFYDGEKENVIPVYENSWYFSGYISQAYTHLKNKGFTHYFVVADDMLLNPEINEHNLFEKTGLKEDECFLDYLNILQHMNTRWHQIRAMRFKVEQGGVEIAKMLPDKEFAKQRLALYGVPDKPIPMGPFVNRHIEDFFRYLKEYRRRIPEYPLVGGYADIMLITAQAMDKFALYCGHLSFCRNCCAHGYGTGHRENETICRYQLQSVWRALERTRQSVPAKVSLSTERTDSRFPQRPIIPTPH